MTERCWMGFYVFVAMESLKIKFDKKLTWMFCYFEASESLLIELYKERT